MRQITVTGDTNITDPMEWLAAIQSKTAKPGTEAMDAARAIKELGFTHRVSPEVLAAIIQSKAVEPAIERLHTIISGKCQVCGVNLNAILDFKNPPPSAPPREKEKN